MRKLILVKHAPPLIDPAKPAEQWRLSEKGRALCAPLAEQLAPHAPRIVISSVEPKAAETAELVAEKLNVPHETAIDLHEHDRSNVPHLRSGEFISMIEVFFRKPADLVLGRETANAALGRFDSAIEDVLALHAEGTVCIVSHGTVIALFISHHARKNGFQLWREMALPSFVVMAIPGYTVEQVVPRIGA